MNNTVDAKYLTDEDVVKLLNRVVSRYDSQAQAAEEMNVPVSHMSAVLHRKASPGAKLLKALRLKKLVYYTWE